MSQKPLRLFVKAYCGWCHEAQAWFDRKGIDYELLDVVENREALKEMYELSGQMKAPTLVIDDLVLADFGVDELEVFWKKHFPESK